MVVPSHQHQMPPLAAIWIQSTFKELKMFDRIVVAYWVPTESIQKTVGIPHNHMEYYSKERRNEIIDKALDNKLHVMLKHGAKNHLIIYIDNMYFRQR